MNDLIALSRAGATLTEYDPKRMMDAMNWTTLGDKHHFAMQHLGEGGDQRWVLFSTDGNVVPGLVKKFNSGVFFKEDQYGPVSVSGRGSFDAWLERREEVNVTGHSAAYKGEAQR